MRVFYFVLRASMLAALASLVAIGAASAQTAADRLWVAVEALGMTVRGDEPPPLVTTSPAGTAQAQAGVLSAPGTTILFGESTTNDDWRPGGRIEAGYWFDANRTLGVAAGYFHLADVDTDFSASSGGTPILARPFFNTATGAQDALLVAFPAVVSGRVAVSEQSTLQGADASLRADLCTTCQDRVRALVGYRYMRATDHLTIEQDTAGGGATVAARDSFEATNNFHGLDLGLTGEIRRGSWSFDGLAKVAAGATLSTLRIDGSTTTTAGGVTTTSSGGLLALSSNIGSFDETNFAVVPEIAFRVGYDVTPQLALTLGFEFVYWSRVVRAGRSVDTSVNPNLIPPAVGGGANSPQPQPATSALWAEGFRAGITYRF